MSTAPSVRPTTGRTHRLPTATTAALALTWGIVAAVTVVDLVSDDAIDVEEIGAALVLALAATVLRAAQALVTDLRQHRTETTSEVTIAIDHLRSQVLGLSQRVESLHGVVAENAALHADRCDRSAASAAKAVFDQVETMRDLRVLTEARIAEAQRGGQVALLDGRRHQGVR